MSIDSINPSTNKLINSYKEMSDIEVKKILQETDQAYLSWKKTSFETRSKYVKKIAEILRNKKEVFAKLMTDEMGKPIKQARVEVEKCAYLCDFYAEKAESFLRSEIIQSNASKSFVSFQAIGVVFAIMPWNFPFWQVFRFLIPAIMAGNAGILKHASNVPGCAIAIEEIVKEANFPNKVFRTLLIGSRKVNSVIENPVVKAVTLTGSTPAGIAVASKSGEMLKKTVLELGGSDPYIILEDADLEKAVSLCVTSRLINAGQSCIAAKRFIVIESILNKFETMFVEQMKDQKMGNPINEDTDIGPMARLDLRDELHEQVLQSVKDGAKLLCGGEIPKLNGAFYPPTVLTNVTENILAYREEMFGPVASIIVAKNEKDAIEKANDTIFGLGAAIFTKDIKKGEKIAEEMLEAGACFVNDFVKSDPRLPFGGIKGSGYGRELSSFGIREFVNIKTVYIA